MKHNTIDDIVLALDASPIDPRTGNKVLYSASWVADKPSMIGQVNKDWVRRELDWFNKASDSLDDMEGPVPTLFQQCAGEDNRVNSAYGYILYSNDPDVLDLGDLDLDYIPSLYSRALDALLKEGLATRHAVVIISDRDVHAMSRYNGRNDFICTNALNFMVDAKNRLHIIAQMRSMDAVFGYRADYSMWDDLMKRLIKDINKNNSEYWGVVTRGDITFQVANLHVYPRHLEMLSETAADTEDRLARRAWMSSAQRTMMAEWPKVVD